MVSGAGPGSDSGLWDLEMLQRLFGAGGVGVESCFESSLAGTRVGKILGVKSAGG